MTTVLVVDDEPNIIELARLYLLQEGFKVLSAADGEEALQKVSEQGPDLMLLDIGLPKIDGWDVCRRLRAAGNTLPIIVLTARGDDVDKIIGLEIGADDYVTKPFNPREVVARARALLRRSEWERQQEGQPEPSPLQAGELRMDPVGRRATVAGREMMLRPREWDLLMRLLRQKNQVLSRDRLLDEVWGYDFHGDTRTVDVHIAALREKLREAGDAKVMIETVWGIGYRLVEAQ